ncbi:MAG: carbonic anhydrase [Thermodesulfobacteriota bacterium]
MISSKVTPEEALRILQEGNDRYSKDQPEFPNLTRERRVFTAQTGQKPFAVVLSCSDSRVPVGMIFDRGVGDIFVVRVAGNVVGASELASIEYAVEQLGTLLVIVMGHSCCGAVKAVVDHGLLPGNLASLSEKIIRSVDKVSREEPGVLPEQLLHKAVEENVWHSIEDILTGSKEVRDRVTTGHVKVLGALYSTDTGKVDWLGKHRDQDRYL